MTFSLPIASFSFPCSYWCCGIPLAAYLAFRRGLGLEGLWWGLVCINTVQARMGGVCVWGGGSWEV